MKEIESVRIWWTKSGATGATAFLLLLLAVDLVFLILHFLQLTDLVDNPLFSVETDRGYPEFFQYLKISSIVILLLSVLSKTRLIGYGVWSALFLYLVLDDAFRIHETLGAQIALNMAFVPAIGLRAKDFGELSVTAITAVVFLVPLAMFYARGINEFREVTRHLLWLLAALVFFGVVVDMLHVALDFGWKVSFLLGVLEDGGEMVVMSIMAWYVFLLNGLDGRLTPATNN